MFEGDLSMGELEIGQVASLIDREKSVEEIFCELKSGFAKAQQRLQNLSI